MAIPFLGTRFASFLRYAIYIVLLLGLAISSFQARRWLIANLFVDASPIDNIALRQGEGPGLSPSAANNVLILDGLDLQTADRLENFGRICDRGLRLTVDVGFPTVSLPVQHALWTGLTQQQSGIQYRIRSLDVPPNEAIPIQIPYSRAIVQDHVEIANSFGFSEVIPDALILDDAWRHEGFFTESKRLVAGNHRLLLIHVLTIDSAGHRWGRNSEQFAVEAKRVDDWLGELAIESSRARWFILSDHGHRSSGGHGGIESSIRMVRACIVGPRIKAERRPTLIHLVDFSHALAGSLELELDSKSQSRPLSVARKFPEKNATIPMPSSLSIAIALILLVAGLYGLVRIGVTIPLGLLFACIGAQILSGPITLSCPAIYPPWGLQLLLGTWPGVLVFGVRTWDWIFRHPRRIVSELAIGVWLAGILFLLCVDFAASEGIRVRILPYISANLIAMLWIVSVLATVATIVLCLGCFWLNKKKATR